MKTEPPRWHPYDPADPPPDIDLLPGASLVVLLATAGAQAGRWAPRAAISLARGLAGKGRRVFLADLGLSRPELHEILGAENGEGISDAFLYGASLRRVGTPQQGFFFAAAGTPVGSGEGVLASPRWNVLAQGFARARAQFLVYLPQSEPGHEALLARADQVIVLSSPGERSAPLALAGDGGRLAAVLWPPNTQGTGRPQPAGTVGVGAAAAPGSARAGAPGSATQPREAGRTGPAGRPRSEGARPASGGGGTSSARVVLFVVLALLLLAVVLGMLGVVRIPGFAADERGVVAPALARPSATANPSFSLTLGSYREAAVARLQAEALGRERPDLLFVVAPVEVDGEVFHRLLAGPSTDSLAGGLRAEVARTLTEEDPAGWVVRATPLAFHLGVQATLEEAGARTADLLAREVPAYVLADGEGEALRFHVWAGAFADPREAAWLQGLLEREGIPAPLQRRRGRLPG